MNDAKPFDGLRKNAITIQVSRDMLVGLGMVEPTPEEKAEQDRRMVRYKAWESKHAAQLAAMTRALDERGDRVTRLVLDLHSRTARDECSGCDYSGYESEPPEWPCRTIEALAHAHGIPMPDRYVP